MKICFPLNKPAIQSFERYVNVPYTVNNIIKLLPSDSRRIAFIVTNPTGSNLRLFTSPIPSISTGGILITAFTFDLFVMGKIGNAVKSEWYAVDTNGNGTATIIEFLAMRS